MTPIEPRCVMTAYLTFVAVETGDDHRRHTEAQVRRHERLRAAGRTEGARPS